MVKFSHSLFALPFALAGAALAAAHYGMEWRQLAWIVVAMIGARNAAMGFNRLADHRLDAANPRTSARELPSGALGRGAREQRRVVHDLHLGVRAQPSRQLRVGG